MKVGPFFLLMDKSLTFYSIYFFCSSELWAWVRHCRFHITAGNVECVAHLHFCCLSSCQSVHLIFHSAPTSQWRDIKGLVWLTACKLLMIFLWSLEQQMQNTREDCEKMSISLQLVSRLLYTVLLSIEPLKAWCFWMHELYMKRNSWRQMHGGKQLFAYHTCQASLWLTITHHLTAGLTHIKQPYST